MKMTKLSRRKFHFENYTKDDGMDSKNWQQRRDILICVICIGIILWAAWNILGQFVDAIIILLLSMAVAFLLTPLVDYLEQHNAPRILASLLVYVVVLGALSFLAYELVFTLIQQVVSLSDTIVNVVRALPDTYANFITYLETQGGIPKANIDQAIGQIQGQVTTFAQAAANNALNIAFFVTNTFINILLVVVLSFYLTIDGKRIRDSLISIVPKRSMSHVLLFEDALNRVVGNYIRGQLTLALIIGILAGLVCLSQGKSLGSYALIIGVLAFLFETIPMVGPTLASVPAILLSLLLPDPFPRTFWVIFWFFVIQMVESNILGPRIVGHAVGLHPVASILALLVGAKLFGAFGALLATPVVAAAWVVIASLYRSARGESADEILSRRRPSWRMTLRHPSVHLPRRQQAPPVSPRKDESTGDVQHSELLHVRTQTGEPQRVEDRKDDQ
jgi:predicted PurR-regulated permease PerM